jgi:hypothetical protein
MELTALPYPIGIRSTPRLLLPHHAVVYQPDRCRQHWWAILCPLLRHTRDIGGGKLGPVIRLEVDRKENLRARFNEV